MPDLHVCAAGSLLGVKLGHKGSFPVGQVQFFDMHPMSFREFLIATETEAFASDLSKMEKEPGRFSTKSISKNLETI